MPLILFFDLASFFQLAFADCGKLLPCFGHLFKLRPVGGCAVRAIWRYSAA